MGNTIKTAAAGTPCSKTRCTRTGRTSARTAAETLHDTATQQASLLAETDTIMSANHLDEIEAEFDRLTDQIADPSLSKEQHIAAMRRLVAVGDDMVAVIKERSDERWAATLRQAQQFGIDL